MFLRDAKQAEVLLSQQDNFLSKEEVPVSTVKCWGPFQELNTSIYVNWSYSSKCCKPWSECIAWHWLDSVKMVWKSRFFVRSGHNYGLQELLSFSSQLFWSPFFLSSIKIWLLSFRVLYIFIYELSLVVSLQFLHFWSTLLVTDNSHFWGFGEIHFNRHVATQ